MLADQHIHSDRPQEAPVIHAGEEGGLPSLGLGRRVLVPPRFDAL